ncbi:MAG TPA: hypothetical protein VF595_07630 [Tepidisphaeraceae bacterium]
MTDTTTEGNRWSWAAYLGASWTWCIGMFLPVLLIRDYGPWAWVIFAVPNAVGAAAMGWVMRTREMSRDYTVRHALACRLFSFVTIAFQLFFAVWMLPRLVGPAGYVGAIVLVQSAFTPVIRQGWLRAGGVVALGLSYVFAIALALSGTLTWPAYVGIGFGNASGLLLVCLAGFIACPYLDLTFHRARQSTSDADAKFAFGFGFCGLFASMIVLTFFYATNLFGLGGVAAWLLAAHLLLQMTYTVHVHAAELLRQATTRDDSGVMRAGLGAWLAVGLVVGLAAVFGLENGFAYQGRSLGELGYRTFMSFYGLLFPAYVLLAIGRRGVATAAWLTISALATPFYWLAFLEGRMAWAIAGVGVLVGGVLLARTLTRSAAVPPTE